jgi:DnaJ family protein C protein 7
VVQTPIQKPQAPPPPEPKPQIDSEAHKAAGNKFFKAKEYAKAIEEYSKGTKAMQLP